MTRPAVARKEVDLAAVAAPDRWLAGSVKAPGIGDDQVLAGAVEPPQDVPRRPPPVCPHRPHMGVRATPALLGLVMSQKRDRPAVGRPDRMGSRPRRLGKLPGNAPSRSDDPDVEFEQPVVGVRKAVRDEGDSAGVGRPGRASVVPVPSRDLLGPSVPRLHDPDVVPFGVEEARPLFLVAQPRHVAQKRRLLLLCSRVKHECQPRSVGRPLKSLDLPGRQLGDRSRLPSRAADEPDLCVVLGRADECDRLSVGGPPGERVVSAAARERSLANPELGPVLLPLDPLHDIEDLGAVRRDARIRDEPETKQILGGDRPPSWHVVPQKFSSSQALVSPEAT